MYEITFENKNGDRLQFGAGTPYTIKEFQGLNPPKATINTSEAAFVDGSIFNSSKLQSRRRASILSSVPRVRVCIA